MRKKALLGFLIILVLAAIAYSKIWYFYPQYKTVFISDKSFETEAQKLRIPNKVLKELSIDKKVIYKYKCEEIAGYITKPYDNYEFLKMSYLETYSDFESSSDMESDVYSMYPPGVIDYTWLENHKIYKSIMDKLTDSLDDYELLYYRYYKAKDKEYVDFVDRGEEFLNIVLFCDENKRIIHIYRKWSPIR